MTEVLYFLQEWTSKLESSEIDEHFSWAIFVLKHTSLRRSKGCCAGFPLLRDQLPALFGQVMFELVTWSWFGPVVGFQSSHLFMHSNW